MGSPEFQGGFIRHLSNAAPGLQFVGSQNKFMSFNAYLPHEGRSGSVIAAHGATILSNIDVYLPEIVLIMFGTNEVQTNTEDVDELYTFATDCLAKSSVNTVIVGNCPPRKTTQEQYAQQNDYRADIEEKFTVTEAPLPSGMYFCDPGEDITDSEIFDSIHPNNAGYQLMAAVWKSQLVQGGVQLCQPRAGADQEGMVF